MAPGFQPLCDARAPRRAQNTSGLSDARKRAMPIRFRCGYCNQLMGIARRKAGTVVSCPTCSGQVVGPTPEPSADPSPEIEEKSPPLEPAPAREAAPDLFERSDFGQDLFSRE